MMAVVVMRRDHFRCDGWRSRRWLAGMMARRNDAIAIMAVYSLAIIGMFRNREIDACSRAASKSDSDIDAPTDDDSHSPSPRIQFSRDGRIRCPFDGFVEAYMQTRTWGGGGGGDTIITKIIENDALQWLEGTFKNVIMGLAVDVPTSSFLGGVEGRDIGRRLLQ